MAAKQLVFGEEARRQLKNGIDVVAAMLLPPPSAPKAAMWPWTANSVPPPSPTTA